MRLARKGAHPCGQGEASSGDLDLLIDIANNIEGARSARSARRRHGPPALPSPGSAGSSGAKVVNRIRASGSERRPLSPPHHAGGCGDKRSERRASLRFPMMGPLPSWYPAYRLRLKLHTARMFEKGPVTAYRALSTPFPLPAASLTASPARMVTAFHPATPLRSLAAFFSLEGGGEAVTVP